MALSELSDRARRVALSVVAGHVSHAVQTESRARLFPFHHKPVCGSLSLSISLSFSFPGGLFYSDLAPSSFP